MFTVNRATFTGRITKKIDGKHLILEVIQNVHGMDTLFEVFIPENIKSNIEASEGDTVLINHAICYEKSGRRFKVETPSQVKKYTGPDLNSHTFTGMVKAYRQVGETSNLIVEISQDVAGKLPTTFNLFVPLEMQDAIFKGTPMEPGDYVQVVGAICYEKEGETRYKADGNNVGILYFKDYDKGQVNADFLKKEE